MPIVDLSVSALRFPDEMIVDSSVLVAAFVLSLSGVTPQPKDRYQDRLVASFVRSVDAGETTAYVPQSAITETLHKFTMLFLTWELRALKRLSASQAPTAVLLPKDTNDLVKQEPWRIQPCAAELSAMLSLIQRSGFVLVSSHELPWDGAERWHDRLVRTMSAYQQLSNDAMLLMDAQRLGVPNVITLDRDFERAADDCTIYTWR